MAGYLDLLNAEASDAAAAVAEGCRKKLVAPKLTREAYVAVLMKNGCTALAQSLAARWTVECPVSRKDGTLYYESRAAIEPTKARGKTTRRKA